ncbi:hypothetical protein KV557_35465 [Kitasatospora aureofaciens]|uniref:competence protein CoiA family protein n=1 Tax=Kitasatospora aureofaciens TaxID=1894 RepID=UPI001C48A443|nr:hypothetical protein [Kitasatospora aureofaciens]MBV6702342.1 hypothetical protein [Kitasatospora aureofaciens]
MNDYDGELPKRNPVLSTTLKRLLDLDREDLGVPEIPRLWEKLYADKRPVPERGLLCPTCLDARPSQPEWMYLSLRQGRRIASHYNPNRRAHDEPESDEHKAYKERYARAAESDGHGVEIEARAADGRRRTDVLVTGADGRLFGFEPQLSYITPQAVRHRDRIAKEDGITAVWHTVDPKAPLIDQVHWARTDNLPARAIREDRDLLVRGGVRTLNLKKCDHTNPLPCPVKKIGRCYQWHPTWDIQVPQIDDMVRRIAGGVYVPITLKTTAGGLLRFWAPEKDRKVFVSNGGALVDTETKLAVPRQRKSSAGLRDVECIRVREDRRGPDFEPMPPKDTGVAYCAAVTVSVPVSAAPVIRPVRAGYCSAGRTPCGVPGARLYPGGWFCDSHRPGIRY